MKSRTTFGAVAVLSLALAGAAQAAPASTPVVRPAGKPAVSPARQSFYCNMTPPDPAKPSSGPAADGGQATVTGEHESGGGGHGDDKGGKKSALAPAVTPATLQTQQQTAPTPQ